MPTKFILLMDTFFFRRLPTATALLLSSVTAALPNESALNAPEIDLEVKEQKKVDKKKKNFTWTSFVKREELRAQKKEVEQHTEFLDTVRGVIKKSRDYEILSKEYNVKRNFLFKFSHLLNNEKSGVIEAGLDSRRLPLFIDAEFDLWHLIKTCWHGRFNGIYGLKLAVDFWKNEEKISKDIFEIILLPYFENLILLDTYLQALQEAEALQKMIDARAIFDGKRCSPESLSVRFEMCEITAKLEVSKEKDRLLASRIKERFGGELFESLKEKGLDIPEEKIQYHRVLIPTSALEAMLKLKEACYSAQVIPISKAGLQMQLSSKQEGAGFKLSTNLRDVMSWFTQKNSVELAEEIFANAVNAADFNIQMGVAQCNAKMLVIHEARDRAQKTLEAYHDFRLRLKLGSTQQDETPQSAGSVYEYLRRCVTARTELAKALSDYYRELFKLKMEQGALSSRLNLEGVSGSWAKFADKVQKKCEKSKSVNPKL